MSSATRNTLAWILQVLLGAAFLFFGGSKLADLPATAGRFQEMGLPAWFAYLIGGAEVLGGLGLLLPRTARLAALGLIVIMLGAVTMHLTRIPGGIKSVGVVIAMLVLLGVVAWLRRPANDGAAA